MENGPRCENGQKNGQKFEMALDPEMGKKWPQKGEKMGLGGHFLVFGHFWAIFPAFPAEGHFLFFGHFLPIFRFGPFPILYQADWPQSSASRRRTTPATWPTNPEKSKQVNSVQAGGIEKASVYV